MYKTDRTKELEEVRQSVREHRQATHKSHMARYDRCQEARGITETTLTDFLQTTEVKTESGKSTGFTYSKKMEDVRHNDSTCACKNCERVRRVRYMKARRTDPDTKSRYY